MFGFQAFLSVIVFIWMLFTMHETRGTVLLSRRAKLLTKVTGKLHRCRADDERAKLSIMLKTSLTRPFLYLFTEPIVLIFSLWVGVAWGVIFLSLSSTAIAFRQAYDYSSQTSSFILMGIAAGGVLGWLLSFHQEHLYRKAAIKAGGKAPPEARLYCEFDSSIDNLVC